MSKGRECGKRVRGDVCTGTAMMAAAAIGASATAEFTGCTTDRYLHLHTAGLARSDQPNVLCSKWGMTRSRDHRDTHICRRFACWQMSCRALFCASRLQRLLQPGSKPLGGISRYSGTKRPDSGGSRLQSKHSASLGKANAAGARYLAKLGQVLHSNLARQSLLWGANRRRRALIPRSADIVAADTSLSPRWCIVPLGVLPAHPPPPQAHTHSTGCTM